MQQQQPGGAPSVSTRLSDERVRLDMSIMDLAQELGNVCQKVISSIEAGLADPLLHLESLHWSRMAHLGMDINYIFTGQRLAALQPDEAALLDNYRACSREDRDRMKTVGIAFTQPQELTERAVL